VKIHEYQAKALLRDSGIPVPRGDVAETAGEARAIAARLGGPVVVKAQVHAGGRGKAGGVKLAQDPAAAEAAAAQILGMMLRTPQTPPEGIRVLRVLVEEASPIAAELYLSVTLDRARSTHVVMASRAGGMEIEEVATAHPERIVREWADPALGLQPFQARALAFGLGLSGEPFKAGVRLALDLFRLYLDRDCSLAEINPLVVTRDGRLLALDAKLNFDDNALFRHPEVVALRDLNEEAPLDVEASRHGLNYIKLDGDVGCMVNGAGLAMATMDIIKLAGGQPANFLDVGGGASAEQIEHAFRILSSDPAVRAVFINVFGGILRCDRLAEGLIAAVRKLDLALPVVVRMEGTNVELGRKMLAESGLNFATADDMGVGAATAVALARGHTAAVGVRPPGGGGQGGGVVGTPPPAG
jgi:succinyl-CoA synthetase beta subunit